LRLQQQDLLQRLFPSRLQDRQVPRRQMLTARAHLAVQDRACPPRRACRCLSRHTPARRLVHPGGGD
jgi:hypothetical protein